jgi:CheY-like chemotaxis protein
MSTILIADDNPISRELVRELIAGPGRVILEASHGQEALERIAQAVPDLVLLDIQMPFLDGFGVFEEVRRDPRLAGVRIVALTAYAMQGDRQRALALGFDDYITKPIDGTALRKRVEELLGEHPE